VSAWSERVAEERGGGEVVHLPREHRPSAQRVDQVVRMVDAEEHRTKNQIQNRAIILTTA